MRIISVALVLTTLSINPPAQAGHTEECERSEYAQQYAASFSSALNAALKKIKAQDGRRRAKLDEMKAALIKATAWTEAEASDFMIKATLVDEDAKALEADRKKAASDFKVQLLALDGIPMIVGGNKAEESRATCLLGPAAIGKSDVLLAAAERAWDLLESKIAAQTRMTNHAAAPAPSIPIKEQPAAPRPPENSGVATVKEVPPRSPWAIASIPNHPAPANTDSDGLNTENWHGTMACGERFDGMGRKSYEAQFTMGKRGGDVTLARHSATATEVLSGSIKDSTLKLTGKGTMVDASRSWTFYFSGPFSEGISQWSGKGEMNGGAGMVRPCVLKMRRS
jgi:hypothetical protein